MQPLSTTYLTILSAVVLAFASANNPIAPSSLLSTIVLIVLTFALLFLLMTLQPGLLKSIVFGIFAVLLGQVLSTSVTNARVKGVFMDVLVTVATVAVIFTALAFFDTQNRFLGLGSYLFAALLALIIARLAIVGFAFAGKSMPSVNDALSWFASGLFAAYLAYDTQLMKKRIAMNRGKHDYVDYALGPFLDIVNLFSAVEDLTS